MPDCTEIDPCYMVSELGSVTLGSLIVVQILILGLLVALVLLNLRPR